MEQTIFTIISPIRPGDQGRVRHQLAEIGYVGSLPADDVFGFGDVEMLHFASVFLYDDAADGWSLVFESNIDGAIEPYLDRLLAIAEARDGGAFLTGLYAHCQGVMGGDLATLKRHMLDHVHRPDAGYIAGVGLTRDRIRLDAAIYRVADAALGSGAPALPADQAQAAVFAALDADPQTRGVWQAVEEAPGLSIVQTARAVIALIVNLIGFLILALINAIPERVARQDNERPDLALVRSQTLYEDLLPTNHMVSVVHLHTDWGRQAAKRCAYGLLRGLVTLVFNKGKLGPIETIHFAHWVMLNRGRRLLFVSNFGGSWDSYLDDFTLKANRGLTLAWAHGTGFPKSLFMIYGGAAKGPEFIDWARRSMVPSLVWYKAYPELSVMTINRNRTLRHAVIAARAGRGDTDWLELM